MFLRFSCLFWVFGLILSVIIAPQLSIWTWGPAMLCFAAAALLLIPDLWRGGLDQLNRFILAAGFTTAVYFGIRAWSSPVEELALMDTLLVAMAVSTFLVFQNAFRDSAAQKIIISGIACLLVAQLAVMVGQKLDPTLSIVFPRSEASQFVTGFYGHYSHASLFLVVSSLILMGFGLRGSVHTVAKVFLILLSILGLIGVFMTKSRSGLIGAGVGFGVLLLYWILTAKRDQKKWGLVALIVVPILLLGVGIVSVAILSDVQQTRGADRDLSDMMDNTVRLYYLGIAVSCIALHPFFGGGARSFSWDFFQFWEVDSMGRGDTNPIHVHNEFVQTITDYGVLGAGLLLFLLVGIVINCTQKSIFTKNTAAPRHADAWRIGGIGALAGLFVQSNFEGVLRIPPGAVLLAVCLAAASHGFSTATLPQAHRLRKISLVVLSSLACGLLLVLGAKGTLVCLNLWKPYFSNHSDPLEPTILEQKIEPFSRALDHWKIGSLYQQRAMLFHNLANANTFSPAYHHHLEKAVDDYSQAYKLHPFDPTNPLNRGRALSALKKHAQASASFAEAIRLQGEMEANLHSYLHYSTHLYFKGAKTFFRGNPEAAIQDLELAAKHIEKAFELSWIPRADGKTHRLRANIHILLGEAYQKTGNVAKAFEAYNTASVLRTGDRAHYHAAVLLAAHGKKRQAEGRLPEALQLFIEAQKRLKRSKTLPILASKQEREEWRTYLLAAIQELRDKGVAPASPSNRPFSR